MTIDTGSPVSFLNWATAKQNLDSSKNTRFFPRENLNSTTKFVDYNKQPINILGAITMTIRSAGWEVVGASFLITERRTRCILGLDLQSKVGIHTTQKLAPKEKTRFDVLLCEQSEGWKNKFYSKLKTFLIVKGVRKITLSAQSSNTHFVHYKKKGDVSQYTYKGKCMRKWKNC